MNINDIKAETVFPEDIWKEIFCQQKMLADKYKDIEGMGTLLETTDTNLDTAYGQKWIKDFAWRVTEELAEAIEAKAYKEHYIEELIDALHFLTELTIIAGYDSTIVPETDAEYPGPFEIMYQLGLACNCLKNKPWKQSQMLTDRAKFRLRLCLAWEAMVDTLYDAELDERDIYIYYCKKKEVNKFRIRSKY